MYIASARALKMAGAPKGELAININTVVPLFPKKCPLLWKDWNYPICLSDVQFGQLGPWGVFGDDPKAADDHP